MVPGVAASNQREEPPHVRPIEPGERSTLPDGCHSLVGRLYPNLAVGSQWGADSPDGVIRAEWCSSDLRNPVGNSVLHVTVHDPAHPWSSCPRVIPLAEGPSPIIFDDPPAVMPGERLENRAFRRLTDDSPVSAEGIATGPAIDVGGPIVICLHGEWVYYGYH